MNRLHIIFAAVFSLLFGKIAAQSGVTPPVSFYQLSSISISGDTVNFSQFKGKKVLIVNTASKCGFTPQLKELEQLHQAYKDKLVVIGFPSGDFGSQKLGTNKEIAEFCEINYGVSFLIMKKSSVIGKNENTAYKWLTDKNKNGWNTQEPTWNFCKYLIDEKGRLVAFFPSKVKPLSKDITKKLNQ